MKFKNEEFWQVTSEMFDLSIWLKVKTKKKDLKCPDCKRTYEDIGEKIALMTFKNRQNTHLCNDCARKYIKLGAIDINKIRLERRVIIEEIKAIKDIDGLEFLSTEELKTTLKKAKSDYEDEIKRNKLIEESISNPEDWEIEQYLIDQYDVFQDKKYLDSHLKIEEYFKDEYSDFFDCGQGYCEDEVSIIVKIGKKFYSVDIYAEINGAKQDRGDRLYWVEGIKKVEYREIEKPIKKDKVFYNYSIKLSEVERILLNKYLKRKNIVFKEV